MKKNLNLLLLISLVFLIFISVISYEYQYVSSLTSDYIAIKVTKPEEMSDDAFKGIIIDKDYSENILLKFRKIEKSKFLNKSTYYIYSASGIDINNFGIFSKVILEPLYDVNSSSINNTQMYVKKDTYNDYKNFLEENNIKVENLGQNQVSVFMSRDVFFTLSIFIVINVLILFFYIVSNFKKYSIMKLEGLKIKYILFEEILYVTKQITKFYILILIFLLLLQVILIHSINFDMLYMIFIKTLYYLIFISFIIFLIYITFFKEDFVEYIKKGFVYKHGVLIFLKFILLFISIFIINFTIKDIEKINLSLDKIDEYSKYEDYVISTAHVPYQGGVVAGDDMDKILYDYYLVTKDEFNGVIYDINKEQKKISTNDNGLELLNLKNKDGEDIDPVNYSEDKVTYFKEEISPDDDDIKEYADVEYIQGGFNYLDYDLGSVDFSISEEDGGFQVIYYPDDVSGVDLLNLSATMTRGSYFMNVPGNDKYETLKPYIEEVGGQNYLVSTPSITKEAEERLSFELESIIYDSLKTFLLIFSLFIVIILFIRSYMDNNMKKIVVKELEGRKDYLRNLITYDLVTYSILFIIALLLSLYTFILLLFIFVFNILIVYIESKRYLNKNRVNMLKGE